MSLDANYILVYDNHSYVSPTPMERDVKYLTDNFGGYFEHFGHYNIYWEKPKYVLCREELKNLCADQVLECKDCEVWEIIK